MVTDWFLTRSNTYDTKSSIDARKISDLVTTLLDTYHSRSANDPLLLKLLGG